MGGLGDYGTIASSVILLQNQTVNEEYYQKNDCLYN